MNDQKRVEAKADTKINTYKYKPQHIDFVQRILTKHGFDNLDAVKEIIDAYYDNLSADWHSAGFDDGMVFAEKMQQSDPAFIESIVRQTLEYVAGDKFLTGPDHMFNINGDRDNEEWAKELIEMHNEIVNQIIKKK